MAGELKTSVILNLVDRISAPARRVTQALSGMTRRAGFDQLKKSARGVQTALGNTLKQAASLGKGLALVGGAAAAAGWALTRMVGGVATLGNEIKISSERLGVGAGWLQEWQYAAQQFGVGNDALIDGFKELSLRADEFVMTGGGGAAESFERLGITVKDLRGTAGDTEKLLDLVQSRMGKIENSAAKQRIFDEMFGGSGGEQMVTLLTQTHEELDKLRQTARDSGAILSDEDIEQSRLYVRQMNDLTSSLNGLKNTVMTALLPTINQWLSGVRDLSKENRGMITTEVIAGLKQLWSGLRVVSGSIAWAANLVGGFGNLIVVLASLLALKFIWSLGLSTIAIAKFGMALIGMAATQIPAALAGIRALSLALILSGAPIALIIAGVAAVAAAAYLIYRNWGSISTWFGNMWKQIQAFFDRGIGEIVKDLLSFTPAGLLLKAIDAVFEMFGARPLSELGREWIGGLWSGISERFEKGLAWIKEKVAALKGLMPDWMSSRMGLAQAGGSAAQAVKAPTIGAAAQAVLAPALGAAAMTGRPSPMALPARAEVGGELRIKIDSEGRARVASLQSKGGLEYTVESGMLGVVP